MGYKQEARENHVKKEDEEELRSQMEQMAREKCKDLASKLAECSYGGTKLFAWRCRQQIKEYGKCRHRLIGLSALYLSWFTQVGGSRVVFDHEIWQDGGSLRIRAGVELCSLD
ncbi:hypothetical protein EV1_023656 [Malus domestica]